MKKTSQSTKPKSTSNALGDQGVSFAPGAETSITFELKNDEKMYDFSEFGKALTTSQSNISNNNNNNNHHGKEEQETTTTPQKTESFDVEFAPATFQLPPQACTFKFKMNDATKPLTQHQKEIVKREVGFFLEDCTENFTIDFEKEYGYVVVNFSTHDQYAINHFLPVLTNAFEVNFSETKGIFQQQKAAFTMSHSKKSKVKQEEEKQSSKSMEIDLKNNPNNSSSNLNSALQPSFNFGSSSNFPMFPSNFSTIVKKKKDSKQERINKLKEQKATLTKK